MIKQIFDDRDSATSFAGISGLVKQLLFCNFSVHKQPSIGVLIKRCSENMQQIDRSTLMPKCDFNKVAKHRCSLVNLLKHLWRATSVSSFQGDALQIIIPMKTLFKSCIFSFFHKVLLQL